jgi:hypothetical protein
MRHSNATSRLSPTSGARRSGKKFMTPPGHGQRIVVHDMWESEEQFNAFVAERLIPMAAELGMAEPNSAATTPPERDSLSARL